MAVVGFKGFNKGLINDGGLSFELNKMYKVNGEIQPGTTGNGFHFCSRFENTLRYYASTQDDNIVYTKVFASGKILDCCDTFYDYDYSASSKITVTEILSSDQIFEMIQPLVDIYSYYDVPLTKVIKGYLLSEVELLQIYQTVKEKHIYRIKQFEHLVQTHQPNHEILKKNLY